MGAGLATVYVTPATAAQSSKSDKPEALYPNATRKEPKLDLTSPRDQKAINDGLEAANAGDDEKAEKDLQPIIDKSKSKYAKAMALQGLAGVKYKNGDIKGAITMLQQAIDLGVMPNDTYFQLLYMLAQFQMADQDYQASLNTLAKWRDEGKKETADSYALEGNADYRLKKYPEAIAAIQKAKSLGTKSEPSWDQILMASYAESGQTDQAAKLAMQAVADAPNDATALNNAVAILTEAKQYPQAIDLMEKARANGTLKTQTHYVNLAKLYLITGQSSDDPKPNAIKAAQVLDDGMTKGIVDKNTENYTLLGEAAQLADNNAQAVDNYVKASATASNGDAALRAAQVLITENKYTDAKKYAQEALDKGLTDHKGNAYMVLAASERGLKHKAEAIAAMKKAAEQPETAARAKEWLKQQGGGH
ncbi:MAG: tetratricopeptide repeat protein [Xanthomonadales bacterium]|nr:tetratricopeptide repeat protein [Xanthomonadales bacterium]